MHKVAALLFLVSCADEPNLSLGLWRDNQPIHVVISHDITETSNQAFITRAQSDINRWRDALSTVGCEPPFRYKPSDNDDPVNSIRLVSNSEWTYKGAVGLWSDGVVSIRSEGDGTLDTYAYDPKWVVGLHELGHAIGLPHSKYIQGSPSIMMPEDGNYFKDPEHPLPERDVLDAACLLECGPCPQ